AFDGGDDEVAHVFALDAYGRSDVGNGFAVAAVEGEGDAHFLAVVAADLEPVRAPAQVPSLHRDAAVMPSLLMPSSMATKQQTMPFHDAVGALVIGRRSAFGTGLPAQDRMDTAIGLRAEKWSSLK